MAKIEAKLFVKIWEKVAQQENLTDRGLSLKLGITPSAVTHWRSGRTAFVMPVILDRLKKKLGYTVNFKDDGTWQLHQIGRGTTSTQKTEGQLIDNRGRHSRDTFVWPMSRNVSVSDRGIRFDEAGSFSPLDENDLRRNIWVQVDDDSMIPLVPKGSWLLVQKTAKPRPGELGLVATTKSGAAMIGIVTIDKDQYQIKPANGKLSSVKREEILSEHRVLVIALPGNPAHDSRNNNQRRFLSQNANTTQPPTSVESREE